MQFPVVSEVVIVCKLVAFTGKPFQFVPVASVVVAALNYEMSVAVY